MTKISKAIFTLFMVFLAIYPLSSAKAQCGLGVRTCTASGYATACSTGWYLYSYYTNLSLCDQCAAGTYTNTYTARSCTPCPIGTYQPNRGASSCMPCPNFSYQRYTGKTSCDKCPNPTYITSCNKADGATYSCVPGAFWHPNKGCIPCSAGTYIPWNNLSTTCSECGIGKYQNATGKTSCNDCPEGRYQSKTGQATCLVCPENALTCNKAGFTCDVGHYVTVSSCEPCPVGKYQNAANKTTCINCPAGQYQDQIGQASCKPCPENATCTSSGASCKNGQLLISDACKDCPRGNKTCADNSFICPEHTHYDADSNVCCPNGATCHGPGATCSY